MRLRSLWIVALVVAALLLLPLPLDPLARNWFALTSTIENAGHPLVFWWLTALLLPVVRRQLSNVASAYGATLVLAIAFGLGTEYVQSLVGRDASWEDARNDVLGAMFALALQARRDLRPPGHGRWRPVAAVAAVVLFALCTYPLAWTIGAYVGRWSAFPVIWSSDYVLARRFSYWKQDAYPGLVIDEPARDWRGFTALQVKVRSLRNTGTEIRVRVHDQQHNQEFLDRYDKAFELPDARERTLTIQLDAIRHGPANRELDLSAVRGIIIFQEGSRESPRFVVDEIRLVN